MHSHAVIASLPVAGADRTVLIERHDDDGGRPLPGSPSLTERFLVDSGYVETTS